MTCTQCLLYYVFKLTESFQKYSRLVTIIRLRMGKGPGTDRKENELFSPFFSIEFLFFQTKKRKSFFGSFQLRVYRSPPTRFYSRTLACRAATFPLTFTYLGIRKNPLIGRHQNELIKTNCQWCCRLTASQYFCLY